MAKYVFVTEWQFQAPVALVWDDITHPLEWPNWWRGVESVVELESGDEVGVGCIRRFTWKSALPYRLTFDGRCTRIEHHRTYELEATGQLQGHGLWSFSQFDGTTHVRYDWRVEATKLWMRVLSPLARPLFAWNHDVVMRWGEEALAARLADRMLER